MKEVIKILLADDDADDCIFFREALDDLPYAISLTTVNNGVELMKVLMVDQDYNPNVLFLDLNMPMKNGIECLAEIKAHSVLKHIPVIICSTSYNSEVVTALYDIGADYYIRKPGSFHELKQFISKILSAMANKNLGQPSLKEFVLQP
ncbi:response regulator [Fulvivirga sp. RKSG066]|uniref:response regulator n=1 Tax=Fulvivirga aurantia TaxID=2529383 RepID=UPI0012BD5209|nr:response regulator [Fulvivirga aurantia]MTI22364.1 response regulator [Fulvivirga aurantia]